MNSSFSHHAPDLEHAFLTRRELLQRVGMGFGTMAAGSLFNQHASAATLDPMAVKRPHFEPKAKRVVHFFMNGGPSQVRRQGTAKRAQDGAPDWGWLQIAL